ncbi:helix-turn-helix transcriptional regulator [Flavobacterium sp. TAB 87]|uniref:helix-turn-helix transcriptional regulator n=1 Tax=Flavobacterium sp. TAB 87 TaxID=1729581 RepID=UPI00076C7663|nr:helix-turn-helix transcriptional regulator [Flavobacterium sp. TAB 87]KVV14710.1 helix-turn-helix protein [Flavobacterium sp. TAB 87]
MVNIEEFIKRLEKILDYYNLNASSFADKIGVQRSSLSHLLSGRNKPSLDFVLKISEVFPEVDLYWILNGEGTFPKGDRKLEQKTIAPLESKIVTETVFEKKNSPEDLFSKMESSPVENKKIETSDTSKQLQNFNNNGEVDKIVFFYKNGTFKIYNS